MAIKRWNTLRLAAWGAGAGLIYGAIQGALLWSLGGDYQARAIGQLIGGLVGGAALIALVSGLRNLILRAR